jgi:hypothetical protein
MMIDSLLYILIFGNIFWLYFKMLFLGAVFVTLEL